ncbi:unnamed protein product [Rotaria sp. Silwood1]|nr:unnamed protein product [Rotaria sp. Silwood1]
MPTKKSLKNRRRFEHKNEKELTYEELFPPYEPLYKYCIYFINEVTSEEEINYLITIAQTTTHFVIDTECNCTSKTPALIQIYFVTSLDIASPLLLVEIDFLPHYSSSLFLKFKELFDYIFSLRSILYSWGFISDELNRFLPCKLFSLPIRTTNYNTQDVNDIVIINAPAYDPTLILPTQLMNDKKFSSGETWSLQDAVVYTFGQYLSKRETLRRWSIGLDVKLPTRDTSFSSNYRKKLINYACLDCVSVAHIHLIMQQSKIPLDTNYIHQEPQTSGEYILSNNLTVLSDMFQLSDDSSSSSEEYHTELVAVHVPNERHQSPSHIIQMDYQQETEAPALVPPTVPRSHKRSSIAKKKRNQKTSRRHRANRYNYEIIRPANMKITSIKKLLRENHIKYTNIHVVHSVLYIGVKSDGHKRLYEQLLPSHMFV